MMTWSVEFEDPATGRTEFVEVKADSAMEAISKGRDYVYAHLEFVSCRIIRFD
jgi:hypothetical protein